MMRGFIQVYTGNGKGKSTAAFGLAVRARGAGLRVVILQFIKNGEYSELEILRGIGVEIQQFGRGLFFGRDPEEADYRVAEEGLEEIRRLFAAGTDGPDVLILDEVNVALGLKLVDEEDFQSLLALRPDTMEVICTGRRAPDSLKEKADLVTEMNDEKHYYREGIPARTGIEK